MIRRNPSEQGAVQVVCQRPTLQQHAGWLDSGAWENTCRVTKLWDILAGEIQQCTLYLVQYWY